MMTAQQLKLLKGLIAFHRDQFDFWDSEDVIDYDKQAWEDYRELKRWLINNSFMTADDDMLDMLKELSA
tara:strand:- start:2320 stop:2526 length:207 start_codon:yes stop_codon:yes gene_type:complete